MSKILLVEDDKSLGFVTRDNLQKNGFVVDLAEEGNRGLELALNGTYDLIILDVMLPNIDGFTIAERIREVNKEIPVLFLSAKSMLDDRLEGLRKGGDDYLTKPYNMEELLLKIDVFLRRSKPSLSDSYQIGQYRFEPDNLVLIREGKSAKLTSKEARLLSMLCSRQGVVIKREEILTEIWGDNDYFLGRSMDVFISKLRKHLKEDPTIQIENYHGVGFKLSVEAAA